MDNLQHLLQDEAFLLFDDDEERTEKRARERERESVSGGGLLPSPFFSFFGWRLPLTEQAETSKHTFIHTKRAHTATRTHVTHTHDGDGDSRSHAVRQSMRVKINPLSLFPAALFVLLVHLSSRQAGRGSLEAPKGS